MKTQSWPRAIWKRLFGSASSRSRAAEFPRFYERKLERRRVLDAGPLGLGATTFDAGTLADDQFDDHFEVAFSVRQQHTEAAVSVNGELVGNDSGTLRIEGSSDHDTLVIDHQPGESATDLSVHYQWIDDSTLEVQIDDHDPNTHDLTLVVSNVEQVIDRLDASQRSFSAGDTSSLTLSDDATAGNGLSQLQSDLGTTIQFASPSEQLTLRSADDTASSATAWRLSSSDPLLTANIRVVGDSADTVSIEESFATRGGSLTGHAGSITVSGEIATGNADLLLVANDLDIESSATLNVGSGNVTLSAAEIDFNGTINASGDSLVRIDAGESGTVEIAGTIEAIGTESGETGGVVAISGREVELLDGTTINVSGQASGGAILIGGGLRGDSSVIRTAEQTTVAEGVSLLANAIESGDGGIVAVWADGFTSYHGRIEARGGDVSGNGGMAEVSGRESLHYGGFAALDAPNGQQGSFVVDPATLTIVQDTPGTDEIETATIEAATMDFTIMADADVIFEDLDSGGTGGDTITLMNNISLSVITFNASGNQGDITFNNAANDLDTIEATGSGSLLFQAGSDGTNPEEADIVDVGNLTADSGNIDLLATDDITILGDVNTGSGNITINADTNSSGGGTVDIGSAVTTTSGNVTISGTTLSLDQIDLDGGSGNIDFVGNVIDFDNSSSAIAGSGTLTIRPTDTTTGIAIGSSVSATFDIEPDEINRLADGFSSITIGDSTSGTGAVAINSATFTDNLSIHGGSIQVQTLSAGANDVLLNARTGNLTARNNVSSVDVTGGSVTLMAAGTIGQSGGNGPLQISATTLTTDTSSANGNQYLSQSGTVAVAVMDAGSGSIELEDGVYVLGSAASIDATALTIQSGADLAGSGTINANVTVTGSDATLTPGNGDTDRLTISGTLNLQSSTTLAITLNGTTVATDYDQVRVSGDVTLGGSLSVSKGFTASIGDTFTIVELTGGASSVTGTFNGLSEGEVFAVGDQFAQITYQGGSGNDVVLTIVGSVFSIAADNASLNEGNTGTTDFDFTVTRSGDTAGTATLTYTVTGSGGNVAEANDFDGGSLPTGMVMFADGETTATITITVVGDTIVEGDETFTVTLSNPPADGTIDTAAASSTITNDDSAKITFTSESVNEETGSLDFTVTLSNAVDVDVSVEFDTLVGGTATVVDDFAAITNQLVTFTAGTTEQTVSVTVVDDSIVEGDETVQAQVDTLTTNGRDVAFTGLVSSLTTSGTITNQDAAVVSLSGGTVDENSGPLQFTVSLDNEVDEDITVRFDTRTTGTASSGDFSSITNQLVTIAAGTLSATVDVTISGDSIVELDETVDARIDTLGNNGRNITLSGGGSQTTGSGTITNDDTAVVTMSGATVDEDSGPLQFTITLSNEVDADISVNFSTLLTGTAGAGDFTGVASQTVTFSAGDVSETVNVSLTADTVVELDESLDARLDTLTPNGREVTLNGGGSNLTATGTIANDDTATITITGETIDEESGDPLFTVTLSNAVDVDITVEFDTLGTGTATVVDDYTAVTDQVVTITAGTTSQTITVPIVDDNIVESDETIDGEINTLTNAGRAVSFAGMATELSATGTITNQDSVTVTLTGDMADEDTGTLQYTVMLSNTVDVDITVEFDTLTSGTTSANDFTAVTNQVVTITAGTLSSTVDVTLTADTVVELDETIDARIDTLNDGGRNVQLSGGGSSTSATGTITNDDDAVITLSGGTVAENGGTLQFTLTMSNEVDTSVSVDFSTLLSGTAGAGDFTGISGQTVTFAQGDVVETVNVTVTDENVVELDETLTGQIDMLAPNGRSVTLSGGGTSQTANGTITNDDSATIELLDVTASEATGQLDFTVQLSNLVDANVSVTFQTLLTGSATPVADYTPVPGSTVTVNALQSTATFTVTVVDDAIVESDETVDARIHSLNNMSRDVTFAGGGTENTATGTIEEDDVQTLTISDPNASESAGVITYQITLGAQADAAIDVTFDTLATGSATAGTDFTALSGIMVTFAAGETSKTVDVTILDDLIVELDETIDARVQATVQGNNLEDTGSGTIANDEQATISLVGATVTEGDSGTINADFVVTLSHDVDSAVGFSSATVDNSAVAADGDYVGQSSTAGSFAAFSGAGAMQTISIAVQGENLVELTESFILQLSSLSSNGRDVIFAGGGSTLDAIGTITNDDSAIVSIANVTADESTGQLQFQLSLTNPVDTDISIDLDTLVTGTATANIDFTAVAGQTINIAANTTTSAATVTVIDENLVEADETVDVTIGTLASVGRDVSLGTSSASGTITNDDSAEITLSGDTVFEASGPLVFTATLSNPVDTAVSIQFDTLATGTAVAGVDFTAIADALITFAAGDVSETVSVTILDDTTVEANETIVGEVNTLTPIARDVSFSGGGASTTALGTIDNDDSAMLTVGSVSQSEGTGGTTNLLFEVTLSDDVEGGFDVLFSVVDGTASDADDFDLITLSPLTFAGTSMETQSIVISVQGDDKVEADEEFTVTLDSVQPLGSIAAGAVALPGAATGEITNDDTTILSVVATTGSSVAEGDTGTTDLTFEVRLSNPTDLAVTTTATTADGIVPGFSAIAGDDYTAVNELITFNAGASGVDLVQTVTVSVNTDTRFELDEILSLNLSNSQIAGGIDGTRLLTSASTANGTIINDDTDIIETGGSNDDRLEITTTGPDSGSFVLTINGVAGPTIPFTGVTSVTFNGLDGSDQLAIYQNSGDVFQPIGGIDFNGGAEGASGDQFELTGGDITTAALTILSQSNSLLAYDAVTADLNDVENILFTPSSAGELTTTFSAPGLVDDAITLDDDGTAANNISRLTTLGVSSPTFDFTNPTTMFTLDAGTGDDTIEIASSFESTSAANTFGGGLTIIGNDGEDTVTFNGNLSLSGNALNVTAEKVAVNSTITTAGGAVLIDSAGTNSSVVVANGASVQSGAGTISVFADGDVTLGLLSSQAAGTAIMVESRQASIIDGETAGALNLIALTGGVQLSAVTGIGDGNPLETNVNLIDASTQTGSLEIADADDLIVEGAHLESASGMGVISIVADSDLRVSSTGTGVSTANGGNITLQSDDLVIEDTASANDIWIDGDGIFMGMAADDLAISPTAVIRTGAGYIMGLPGDGVSVSIVPRDLGGPGINIDAESNNLAIIDIVTPPGSGFEVKVLWNDFVTIDDASLAPIDGNTTITEDHTYFQGNPTGSATNNIPYTVIIDFAYVDSTTNAIQLFEEGELFEFRFDGELTVPVQGLQAFAIAVSEELPDRSPPAAVAREITPDRLNNTETSVNSLDFDTISGDFAKSNVERVELRIVTPTGDEITVFEWDRSNIDILQNLADLFGDLPDDRYRIYLIREDGSEQEVVDVILINHKPYDPLDDAEADRSRPPQEQRTETDEETGKTEASDSNPEEMPEEQSDSADQAATEPSGAAVVGSAIASLEHARRVDSGGRGLKGRQQSFHKAARLARRVLRTIGRSPANR